MVYNTSEDLQIIPNIHVYYVWADKKIAWIGPGWGENICMIKIGCITCCRFAWEAVTLTDVGLTLTRQSHVDKALE